MIFLKFYNSYFDEKDQKAKPISELEERLKKEKKTESEISVILNSERLAYLDYRPINRCPHCKTGLANEDLDDGKCERCGSPVEQRPMRQRVLRITKYAQRLLDWLEGLDWDDSMKELERNWIGRSEGSQFKMKIQDSEEFFEVFTTRLDTVFGMSFVVLAPEHPLVDKITLDAQKIAIQDYKEQAKHKTQLERTELQKEKTWVFTGVYAINPFNNKEIPVYIGDYVLSGYGTGAVMGVAAHDERDFDFAKKYGLEINEVVVPKSDFSFDFVAMEMLDPLATQKGVLVNSGEFSGLNSDEAIAKMQDWLAERGFGGKKVNYKIQDWVFSRQRYWGEPFPIIFSEGKTIALDESDLPLLLPDVDHYEPTGTEEGPLAEVEQWVNTTTADGKPARRETNTMPGWAGSSWYWLRYMDPRNNDAFVWKDAEAYWQNVDTYVGGAEHVTRHIIYARFWQKFLYDLGMVSKDEPFQRYQKVGLIMAEDGRKMSKRRGNVVNPDDVIAEYGADVLRTYEMFMGPFDQASAWNPHGMKGVKKFLDKIIALWDKVDLQKEDENPEIETLVHQTIKKLTVEIDEFKFNTSISQLMILVNKLGDPDQISRPTFENLVLMLSPFAPHLAEEFWERLGNDFSIFTKGSWPKFDEKKLISSIITLPVQINGKMRGTLQVSPNASQDEILDLIRQDEKFVSYLTGEIKKCILVPGKIINIIV